MQIFDPYYVIKLKILGIFLHKCKKSCIFAADYETEGSTDSVRSVFGDRDGGSVFRDLQS